MVDIEGTHRMRACGPEIPIENGLAANPCRPPPGLVPATRQEIIVDTEALCGGNSPWVHLFPSHAIFEAGLAFQNEDSIAVFPEVLGESRSR